VSVRAKFWVSELKRWGNSDKPSGGNVKLLPVYSPDPGHENKAFWEATPQGEISLGISNPSAYAEFERNIGKEFYIDFVPAK